MSTLVCTDLDRTLIYSAAALALTMPDVQAPVLHCVEVYHAKPLSYLTSAAAQAFTALATAPSEVCTVVPTTTRTVAQFSRIHLPGAPWRFAITSNGGNIVVDGEVDRDWGAQVRHRIKDCGPSLQQVDRELERRIDPTWLLAKKSAEDLFTYLVVDMDALPTDFLDGFLAQWTEWCVERGWRVSMQGRKIYSIPSALSKSHAAREVAARTRCEAVIAAGDGLLDVDLITYADRAIRPRHGELERLEFQHPGLQVTQSRGVLAGEEIVNWFVHTVGLAQSEAASRRVGQDSR